MSDTERVKINKGDVIPNFNICTMYKNNINLKPLVTGIKSIIIFIRYYEYNLCQYDMNLYDTNFEYITKSRG